MENKEGAPVSVAMQILQKVQAKNAGVPSAPKPPVSIPSVAASKDDYDFNPTASEVERAEVAKTAPPSEPKILKPSDAKVADIKEAELEEFVPEDPTEEVDSSIDPKQSSEPHFTKLRTKLKYVTKDYRKAQEELEVLRAKVSDYDNGLAVPELTQAQTDRIAKLEVYEKLYNFKASPVYQEKFAKPIKENEEALRALATENQIAPEVVEQALNAGSTVELDTILSRNFKNSLTALEAKSFIKNIRKVSGEALEAEKEPAKALARMQAENDNIIADKRAKANEVILHTSKEGWSESLVELREDTRFAEITFKEGDTEHNEKFVRPILTKAAQEYGRTVKILAEHGLTTLSKDLAKKLARSDQLAHYSAVVINQRDNAYARIAELESLIKNKTSLSRPSLNGGTNASVVSRTRGETPKIETVARQLLQQVRNSA